VGVLFAPDHTPELEIMKQLLKGVLDPGQAAQDWAAPKWLKHPNIELYVHDENIFVMGSTHKKSKRSRWRRTPAGSWRSISSRRSSESSP